MPDSPVISGVADLPKFYFAEGAPFRLVANIGAELPLSGKFVTFGTRARSGTVRRIFGTDSDESNLTISSQAITLNIATTDETVPAFSGGWTLADIQAKEETEYWIDISATEGGDVLLRLQGQADWVAAGAEIAASSAVVSSPEIDVTITSGAVSVSVAVVGGEVGVPVGGSTGQVLRKSSATDYATEWATVSVTGDVVGPASSTDNAIVRFDGTTGKSTQNSGITIADGASGTLAGSNSGDVTLAGSLDYLTISGQTITRGAIDLAADVTGTLPATNGGTGQTSLGAVDASDFGSGAATDGYVLTADGAGGSAWEAASGGGGDAVTSGTLDQFADVTQTGGATLAISASTTLAGGSHSGTNTGDNAVNSLYSGLVTNATHTGDVTGSTALTIADDAVTFAKMQNISAGHLIGRHSSGSGDPEQIGLGGGIELSGANLRRAALTGDVTAPAGDNATTIANGVVTEAKCNSSINASLDLADSSIQPGNAALTDERVPTAAGLTSKFGTNKATIADGDKFAILDSEATDAPKHTLWSLIKSALQTYFDSVYAALGHSHAEFDSITSLAGDVSTLQASSHAAATVSGNGIAITGQQISLDIGTGSTQVAAGDHNHSGTYQPLDSQLTDLAGLSYASNSLKVVRVNAGETAFELATAGGGLTNFTESASTTGTNATVNVAQLIANVASTNGAIALTPKGTGAMILGPVPDGTTTGGNPRGAYSVDLQLNRSAQTQVPSNAYSFTAMRRSTASGDTSAAIGDSCTSSGQYSLTMQRNNNASGRSATAFQELCTASGFVGFASGYRAVANRYGMSARAAGAFSSDGDNQFIFIALRNKTTDATPVELKLDGSSERFTIATGFGFSGMVEVFGFKSDGTAAARYTRRVGIKNTGGTTALVGSVETIGTDHEDAATDISITADDANDALAITVTGIAAETWRWTAVAHGLELKYGI